MLQVVQVKTASALLGYEQGQADETGRELYV
ncbi:hypothetical protein P245_24965 [Comamonas thiooxydans]|uniref:Uncharacterized protein n=1 Tax=Comamonas thiooxydans TaxID=363952 RepID=A0A0E3B8J8_9BURK|nr:hypothetical protein P245_24965 [Comamonas thiooxydans]